MPADLLAIGGPEPRQVLLQIVSSWRLQGGEAELLAIAYKESLKLAEDNNLSSVSFPSISTGAYRYPMLEAAKVAVEAVASFLRDRVVSVREVVFVLFDTRTYEAYENALQELAKGQE